MKSEILIIDKSKTNSHCVTQTFNDHHDNIPIPNCHYNSCTVLQMPIVAIKTQYVTGIAVILY